MGCERVVKDVTTRFLVGMNDCLELWTWVDGSNEDVHETHCLFVRNFERVLVNFLNCRRRRVPPPQIRHRRSTGHSFSRHVTLAHLQLAIQYGTHDTCVEKTSSRSYPAPAMAPALSTLGQISHPLYQNIETRSIRPIFSSPSTGGCQWSELSILSSTLLLETM
ncbi:hypothetical protein BDV96DRAFT_393294 [Lophiotrema nucula]|uniref:Uncharacterized protein n=1 Tax=Lophiotrema nucula TaxID=690887 RepID=A0A6A5ZE73_9PLEO|nr:hypothetical protein BDV96DRAFT_393294 [Lophiotrema nucula]